MQDNAGQQLSQGSDVEWLGVLCRCPTWLIGHLWMSSHLGFVTPVGQFAV